MDTIAIKVIFDEGRVDIDTLYQRIDYIERIKSLYGYRYCDVLEKSKCGNEMLVKISYPRYFYGNNAYLIKTKYECLEVQEHFIEMLRRNKLFDTTCEIFLIRLDIPFTYIMDKQERFPDYSNIFKILGEVCNSINNNSRPKAFIDLITEEKETIIFTDSKVQSNFNIRIMFYDQYLNLKDKLTSEEFKRALEDFPDLPYRMRIELSKRIRRKPFSLNEFAEEDFYSYYFREYRDYLLDGIFDLEKIDDVYQRKTENLVERFKRGRQKANFSYESFILYNLRDIYDYKILRATLKEELINRKTFENAVTTVRKILKDYEKQNHIMVLDVDKKLLNMIKKI